MSRVIWAVLAVLAFGISGPAFSKTQKLGKDFAAFAEQKTQILADLNDGATYKEIKQEDRQTVITSLERIEAILARGDVSEITDQRRAELINHQELVNVILTMAENDSRLVCRRSAPTGSNMKSTNCETLAMRRERQERDQQMIRDIQRSWLQPLQ